MSKIKARKTSLSQVSHVVDTTQDHPHTTSGAHVTAILLSHPADEMRSNVACHFQAEAFENCQPRWHCLSHAAVLEGPG